MPVCGQNVLWKPGVSGQLQIWGCTASEQNAESRWVAKKLLSVWKGSLISGNWLFALWFRETGMASFPAEEDLLLCHMIFPLVPSTLLFDTSFSSETYICNFTSLSKTGFPILVLIPTICSQVIYIHETARAQCFSDYLWWKTSYFYVFKFPNCHLPLLLKIQ